MPKYLNYNDRLRSDEPHNLFYIPPEKIQGNEIIIEDETIHHLKHVLRKNTTNTIFLTDGCGSRFTAEISLITKSKMRAKILKKEKIERNNIIDIELAFVPLKGWRNDFIIEKGTELGIIKFRPFISMCSVITHLSQTKLKRFEKIAISAMLQSQKYYMPEIVFEKDLNELLQTFKNFDLVLLSDKNGESKIPLNARSILYIVGPEGGFDQSEIEIVKKSGAILFSLGPHRLRSETAALCGITKIFTLYSRI